MSEDSGRPIDISKRLKQLSKERRKVADRIRRINGSIGHRARQLLEVAQQHCKLCYALEQMRDELTPEQVELITKILDISSEKIERLSSDIGELSEPNIKMFVELEDLQKEIVALDALVSADTGGPEDSESLE